MNNNQICNEEVKTPIGINLNEKDYLSSLLSSLKDMEKNYAIALTEASNESLFNEYKNTFEFLVSLQRETYELMFKYGWYKLEIAEEQKINNKYLTLSTELENLSK